MNFGLSFHSLNLRIKENLPLIPGALPLKSGGAPETIGTNFPYIALAPALAFFDFRKLFSRTRAAVSLVPREDKEEKYNFEV